MQENQDFEEQTAETDAPQALSHNPNELKKSQKIAAGVLAFFAFLIIIIWVVQFKNSLKSPFDYRSPDQNPVASTEETCPGGNCADNEEDLSKLDTDKDGLSDYDELNYYKTSPYIEDTDSDGLLDGEEINLDEDPLCPVGQDCAPLPASDSSSDEIPVGTGLPAITLPDNATVGDLLGADLDAATLRQLLIANGMQKELLDQISDEELLKSFKDIVQTE